MELHLSDYSHLIEAGLVKASVDEERGLTTLKYTKKVFFKNLWHLDMLLQHARGHVFNTETGELVQRPFQKVFNYGENGAGDWLEPNDYVIMFEKVNGFMAALTFDESGHPLVSTTGSTKSEYAQLAEQVLRDGHVISSIVKVFEDTCLDITFMFEICDPSDPHIVDEHAGAHFIGVISKSNGQMMPLDVMNRVSRQMQLEGSRHHMPSSVTCSFDVAMGMVRDSRKEGFMVLSALTEDVICKMKTPHYLTKKFLMRMNSTRAQEMMNNPDKFKETIDEEFYELVDYLTGDAYIETMQTPFQSLDEQSRRQVIEEYFNR